MTETGVEGDVESKPKSASEDVIMGDVESELKSEAHVWSNLGADPGDFFSSISIVNLTLPEGPISNRRYLAQQTQIALGASLSGKEANEEDIARALVARFEGVCRQDDYFK